LANIPEYNEISDLAIDRPHVVILGAGASRAAFPDGEANGKQLPLMDDLVKTLNLVPIILRYGITYANENFEQLYSAIHDSGNEILAAALEKHVYEYFDSLELPPWPTLYDHLVLSLRGKDLIATFNWDPLLWQALIRNKHIASLPQAVFLHGSVSIGYCRHHRGYGPKGHNCPNCSRRYDDAKLLYPVTRKGYSDDSFIGSQWDTLRSCLEDAYVLTIFGYSAPSSDAEAIQLMKEAWGPPGKRGLEQIEIIDRKEEDELRETWKPFICEQHYGTTKSFYDSWIAKHPRRSCEAVWGEKMEMVDFVDDQGLPLEKEWHILLDWLRPRLDNEKAKPE